MDEIDAIIKQLREAISQTISQLQDKNDALTCKIKTLEEDLGGFAKVSYVVSLESENRRLKEDLAMARTRTKYIEKTIKDVVYFVSDDEHKYIYEKIGVSGVGEKLGQICKGEDGKSRAIWYS
jgi:cell shape-determining protein MreC